jgi:hypothetical protein
MRCATPSLHAARAHGRSVTEAGRVRFVGDVGAPQDRRRTEHDITCHYAGTTPSNTNNRLLFVL